MKMNDGSGYTPSTEELREAWLWFSSLGKKSPRWRQETDPEVNRWLAAHDVVIREDEREKAIDVIRFHRGGYNRTGSTHAVLLKMEDAIRGQSFTGTESE